MPLELKVYFIALGVIAVGMTIAWWLMGRAEQRNVNRRGPMDAMGTYRTTVLIENIANRGEPRALQDVLVDTGSEYTWAPRAMLESLGIKPERRQGFVVADGRTIEREMGFALLHAGGAFAPDYVVFAEPGDMTLLGARTLEGLNVRIDPIRKLLVDAGPVVTAAA